MWIEYRAAMNPEQLALFMPWRNTPGVRSSERLRKLVAALPVPNSDAKLGDVLLSRDAFHSFRAIGMRSTWSGFALSGIGSRARERLSQYSGVLFAHAMRTVGEAFPIHTASGPCSLDVAPKRALVINQLVLMPRGAIRVHAHDVHEGRASWLDDRGQELLAKSLSRSLLEQLIWLRSCGDDVEGRIAREAYEKLAAGGGDARERAIAAITERVRWKVQSIDHVTLAPCHGGWKLRMTGVRLWATAQFEGLWQLGAMKVEGQGQIRPDLTGLRVDPQDVARALAAAGISTHHAIAA